MAPCPHGEDKYLVSCRVGSQSHCLGTALGARPLSRTHLGAELVLGAERWQLEPAFPLPVAQVTSGGLLSVDKSSDHPLITN